MADTTVRIDGNTLRLPGGVAVRFIRTLRLPETGTHPLPPGLGEFPVRRVRRTSSRTPRASRSRTGTGNRPGGGRGGRPRGAARTGTVGTTTTAHPAQRPAVVARGGRETPG